MFHGGKITANPAPCEPAEHVEDGRNQEVPDTSQSSTVEEAEAETRTQRFQGDDPVSDPRYINTT